MLNQFHQEMQRYKDRKHTSLKELECVYYGLENKMEKQTNESVEHHLQKIDEVKSAVSFIY